MRIPAATQRFFRSHKQSARWRRRKSASRRSSGVRRGCNGFRRAGCFIEVFVFIAWLVAEKAPSSTARRLSPPRGVCGLHTFCSDPKAALIRTGDSQVTFRKNFGASASLNCYNGRDETTGRLLELLADCSRAHEKGIKTSRTRGDRGRNRGRRPRLQL